MSDIDAIKALHKCAAIFGQKKHLSLAGVAENLSVSVRYVRDHMEEFPGAFRLPGGDIRIPARDVEALAMAGRIKREVAA
jgi:hypothetical protein